jgi:transcriptional regulator with XRE-family HTH domain
VVIANWQPVTFNQYRFSFSWWWGYFGTGVNQMSAGFDACNLAPVRFVGNPQAVAPEKLAVSSAIPPSPAASPETFAALKAEQSVPRKRQFHCIAIARKQQGISLRTVSRRTGVDIRTLRAQEDPMADLRLSDLHAWQTALEVPLVDLIEDHQEPLSRPVKERACMVRIMKTAVALKELGGSARGQRLANMLVEQLLELMPELEQIGGWPQHGGRRSSSLSRILEQQVDTRTLDQGD